MTESERRTSSTDSRFSLADRVTVITGAGSGMGRACAVAFAEAGATVYALDLDGGAVDKLALEINDVVPGTIEPVQLDATDDSAVAELLSRIDTAHGRIDVLFNHAGRACAPGVEITSEDWAKASDLNLRVPVLLTGAALPLIRKSSNPSLIYTASIAGLVASPNSPLYSALKGAIVQYTKSVAVALGPEGIRANAICPGTMETPMLVDFFRGTASVDDLSKATRDDVDAGVDRFKQQVPLGRTGQPDDVAGLAVFLASDASRYVTGTAIPVDGGYVAR